ncbi:MAG: hypothetical protein CMM87_06425 [Rickettsiales bacterium]|nr:hypothetical protein [Rickettsiales bacterium]|tara:strand:- start:34957 stop:35160 length:204 start_codon:yes stop_codon:yes gene_type:complete
MKLYVLYLNRHWLFLALFMVSFLSVTSVLLMCDEEPLNYSKSNIIEEKESENLEAIKPAIFEIKVHQ